MDFRLDEEQLALQDTVRRFWAPTFPLEGLARREERRIGRAWVLEQVYGSDAHAFAIGSSLEGMSA
jgi:hypothetical protein